DGTTTRARFQSHRQSPPRCDLAALRARCVGPSQRAKHPSLHVRPSSAATTSPDPPKVGEELVHDTITIGLTVCDLLRAPTKFLDDRVASPHFRPGDINCLLVGATSDLASHLRDEST